MDKKLLALDVATLTGWAISSKIYGRWNLAAKRDESKGMRLIRFRAKLKEIVESEEIKMIVFERVAGFHASSMISEAELIGILKLFCEEHGIEYKAYSAGEIKKFGTGKGNANKNKMVEAAREKYGYDGFDDNEADALHLWHLAVEDLKI